MVPKKRSRDGGKGDGDGPSRKASYLGSLSTNNQVPVGEMDKELEASWLIIQEGLRKVFEKIREAMFVRDRPLEKVTLLTTTEYMAIHEQFIKVFYPHGPQRKLKLFRALRGYLTFLVLEFCKEVNGLAILEEYRRCWEGVLRVAKYIRKLSDYAHVWIIEFANTNKMDRIWPIDELMLQVLGEGIDQKLPEIVNSALNLIDEDRRGKSIDLSLAKTVVSSLIALGGVSSLESGCGTKKVDPRQLYKDQFEKPFIKRTRDFYRLEAAELSRGCNTPEFMRKIWCRLVQETERSSKFLHICSMRFLSDAVDQELIGSQQDFIQSNVEKMIREDSKADLKLMFELLSRLSDGLTHVKETLQNFVYKEGSDAIKRSVDKLNSGGDEEALGYELIEKLIQIHTVRSSMVKICFASSLLLHKAIEDSFVNFLTSARFGLSSTAELLARYVDRLLRGACKVNQDELEERLMMILKLFVYIQEKDVFVDAYRRHLSIRLLVGSKEVSEDSELLMIEKLKMAGGHTYTLNLSGMFNDMRISRETSRQFRLLGELNDLESSKELLGNINMSVSILNSLYWPLDKHLDLKIHMSLQNCLTCFEQYYARNTKGRKLSWMHAYSLVILTARFDRVYEIKCNSIQGTVLLMLNSVDSLDLKTVYEELNGTEEALLPHLEVLSMVKISDGVLKLNSSFRSAKIRIVVPYVAGKSLRKETTEKVRSKVRVDRTHQIDAALVRTMKERKQLSHKDLTDAVISQTSKLFKAEIRQIKERIEKLLNQEYIQREESQEDMYVYVA